MSSEAVTRGAADTGVQLGLALLAYMLGVTLMITLLPFDFAWPGAWRVMVTGEAIEPLDVIANVLLFIPLGFLYRVVTSRRGSPIHLLWIGAVASIAIEAAQLFEISRDASVLDVAANAAGAWLGALAFDRVATLGRVDGRVIGWLSLDLPLMTLVYLLIPLLWVNSLASAGGITAAAMTLLLGIFGAFLLAGLQRYYFGPARASASGQTAAFAALWFFGGAFPALPSRPLTLILGTALVGAFCWWQGSRVIPADAANRRFEVPLLTAAAPAYVTYLALITVAPLPYVAAAWNMSFGFPSATTAQLEILRLLELVAAFTLLGYTIAEFGGRVLMRYQDAFPRLIGWGVSLVLVGELVRGFHAGSGASVARGALLVAAALYGGWLYYLQRAHVMRVISVKRENSPADASP